MAGDGGPGQTNAGPDVLIDSTGSGSGKAGSPSGGEIFFPHFFLFVCHVYQTRGRLIALRMMLENLIAFHNVHEDVSIFIHYLAT